MTTMIVPSGDAEIAVETFGDANDPPILLIMGAMASMLWWPDGFCDALAGRGRYVIRYDNRDTGLSTAWPPGKPGYTFADMAGDPIAILDALGIDAVHLVGMSMGGMIAQRIALLDPERVLTLAAISTSPIGVGGLPKPTEAYARHVEGEGPVDRTDKSDVIRSMLRECRALAGTVHPFDEAGTRALIARDFDRSRSYASAANHFQLPGEETEPDLAAEDIPMPVLVVHGSDDPIFPIEHGQAFARVVMNGRLLVVAGGGHELHEMDWPGIIDGIVRHTSAGAAPA